jgi:transposase
MTTSQARTPDAVKKPGPKTSLTPEMQGRVIDAIRAGNYLDTAAAYAGIHRSTLHDWLKRGRSKNPEEPFASFVEAVEEAMGKAETRFVALIAEAAQTTWTAAAWWLERRYPDRWGRRERIEHTGKDGDPIEYVVSKRVEEKIDELAERRNKQTA